MLGSKRTAIGCWMGKGGAIPLISQWAVVFHKRLGLRAWTKSRTVIQKNRSNTHGTYPDHFQKWRKSTNIIGFSQEAEFRGKADNLHLCWCWMPEANAWTLTASFRTASRSSRSSWAKSFDPTFIMTTSGLTWCSKRLACGRSATSCRWFDSV